MHATRNEKFTDYYAIDFCKIEIVDGEEGPKEAANASFCGIRPRSRADGKVLPTFYTSACSSSLRPQARRSRLKFQNREGESVKLRLRRKRRKMSLLRIGRREGVLDKRDSVA